MRTRIRHLQQTLREAGRIRMGYSTLNERGNKIPHKLNRWRFTAPEMATIEAVAARFGGTPEPWPEGGRDRYQVVTDTESLDAMFPIGVDAVTQRYEQYRGGFLAVSCDGDRRAEPGPNGRLLEEGPCQCDPDQRDCTLSTSLRIILRDLPGISTWRLVTHSYYAACELTAAADLIEQAMAAGMSVPVRVFFTERERKALVDGKPMTKRYPVVALDLSMSVAALGSGGPGGAPVALPLPAGASGAPPAEGAPPPLSAWRPVDQGALAPAPIVNLADQLADNERPAKRRANSPPPVPATGRKPRSAAQATADAPNCSLCGLPYGTAKLSPNPEPGGSRFVHATCAAAWSAPETQEGEPAPDQPPARDVGAHGGGGAADNGETSAGVDPTPAVSNPHLDPPGYQPMMSPKQYSMAMALMGKAWPGEGMSGREVDAMRRDNLLGLCELLGQPGLTSRKEIDAATAPLVLDALEAIVAGTLELTDAGLVDTATGEITLAFEQ